jgi:hypothetical protein
VADQLAEHPASPGKGPDLPAGPLVDPDVQEALEPRLLLVEDAERRVPGAGQTLGGIQNALEDRLRIELRDDRSANLQKLIEALVRERGLLRYPSLAHQLSAGA